MKATSLAIYKSWQLFVQSTEDPEQFQIASMKAS